MTISPDRLLPQQQIYNFLRTVTIKYTPIAMMLNDTLLQKGYVVNGQDPTTWKYYLNMVGQYHTSDVMMTVTSLDTRQTITFTPENLTANPRTKAAYLPGGQYYTKLCATYPDQVDLIKSILFPVPSMAAAISADDFTLLTWGEGYLESWEEPVLIMAIEKFLKIYVERWYFDFLDDEPYFYITAWGSLWTYLAMLLISERMGNIKTPYVHSWHIWNELEANGLDNYSDILDREKAMFLYQNIDYLKANAGKQSNLIILANRLLDNFGVGLYGRMVVQESQTGAANYQLTPQLVPIKIPTNTAALTAEIATESVATIQSQIFAKGLTSSEDAETIAAVERKLGDTTLNYYRTKFLEIRPIPRNKPYAETLNMFLIETLVLSIIRGYYNQPVEIIDPLTSNALYLPPAQLLAVYNYAVQKSLGITPTTFPAKANFFTSFTTTIGTPTTTIPWQGQTLYLSSQIDAAAYLSGIDYNTDLRNPTDFSTMVSNLWIVFLEHILMDENTSMENKHVMMTYLSSLCHQRREETINLVPDFVDYPTWFGAGGLDITTDILAQYAIAPTPEAAWGNLADTILTGLVPMTAILTSFGNFTPNDVGYDRLRQLFVQMCSYRVVFIDSNRETNEFLGLGKWSHNYDPNLMHSYSDYIILTNIRMTDKYTMTNYQYLHQGFKKHIKANMGAALSYTVTPVKKTGDMVVTQPIPKPESSIQVKGTQMSQGVLKLPIAPVIAVDLNPPTV